MKETCPAAEKLAMHHYHNAGAGVRYVEPHGLPIETPPGTRLILAQDTLLDKWGARTDRGEKIIAEWGDPESSGWYEPTFHVDSKDNLVRAALKDLRAKVAALPGYAYDSLVPNTGPNLIEPSEVLALIDEAMP